MGSGTEIGGVTRRVLLQSQSLHVRCNAGLIIKGLSAYTRSLACRPTTSGANALKRHKATNDTKERLDENSNSKVSYHLQKTARMSLFHLIHIVLTTFLKQPSLLSNFTVLYQAASNIEYSHPSKWKTDFRSSFG